MKYQVNSRHAEVLASGASVAPDQLIQLNQKEAKDPHNRRLIEDGVLVSQREDEKQDEGDD